MQRSYIVSASGLLSFKDIQPIDITSGTSYFISVNTGDYCTFNDGENVVFPVEHNNVLILGCSFKLGNAQFLPNQLNKTSYLGMVDIKFEANN